MFEFPVETYEMKFTLEWTQQASKNSLLTQLALSSTISTITLQPTMYHKIVRAYRLHTLRLDMEHAVKWIWHTISTFERKSMCVDLWEETDKEKQREPAKEAMRERKQAGMHVWTCERIVCVYIYDRQREYRCSMREWERERVRVLRCHVSERERLNNVQ